MKARENPNPHVGRGAGAGARAQAQLVHRQLIVRQTWHYRIAGQVAQAGRFWWLLRPTSHAGRSTRQAPDHQRGQTGLIRFR